MRMDKNRPPQKWHSFDSIIVSEEAMSLQVARRKELRRKHI